MYVIPALLRRSVSFALVTPGSTAAERELNAKYLISTARKMGCFICLLWCAPTPCAARGCDRACSVQGHLRSGAANCL